MSRHRNVRTMNYDDEYDDDDDYQYGHSVEDDCISPTDAQQWMYDRAKGQQSMSAFLANNRDIEEEDDDGLEADRSDTSGAAHKRRDSECYQLPELNDEDRVRLNSCMDEIRNIVGESVTDRQLVEAIMKHGYNFDLALDDVLNSTKTPPTASVTSPVAVAKPLQTTIEKDSKLPQMFPSIRGSKGGPTFALPNVRFGAGGTGTNLSDLVKSRMKKSDAGSGSDSDKSDDVEEAVPSMANLSLSNDSGVASSSPSEGTFSNLADLAKFHLQSKGGTSIGSPLASKTGTFAIPSLFNTPTNRPPALASAALANSQQTPLSKKEWIVDLKSALIKDKSEISSRPVATPSTKSNDDVENESPSEQQHYGFIDCDIPDEEDPAQKPIFDEFCSIDASSISQQNLPNVTSVSSGLATVLCRRYRKRTTIRVRHGFVIKPKTGVAIVEKIVPFRFHVPSPDDVILGHMKKFRR